MLKQRQTQKLTCSMMPYVWSMCACMLSHFSCVRLFATLWSVAHQASLSMGFSRQEYWSGLPCPSPGDLPNPEIEPASLLSPALAGRFFTTSATWEALIWRIKIGKTNPCIRSQTRVLCLERGHEGVAGVLIIFFILIRILSTWMCLPCGNSLSSTHIYNNKP